MFTLGTKAFVLFSLSKCSILSEVIYGAKLGGVHAYFCGPSRYLLPWMKGQWELVTLNFRSTVWCKRFINLQQVVLPEADKVHLRNTLMEHSL
jgi:hypothetical protein